MPLILDENLKKIFSKISTKALDETRIDAPLSSLGIDSLTGIEILGEIEEKYGVSIPPEEFFQGLTIRHIVEKIHEKHPQNEKVEKVEDTFELTDTQKGFWSSYKLIEDPVYHAPIVLKFPKRLEKEKILSLFSTFIDRHPLLRSRIVSRQGKLMFEVLSNIPVPYTDLGVKKSDQEVQEGIDRFLDLKFDLGKGPLFRVAQISKENTQECYLLIVFYHIIEDGWSSRGLILDLADLLNGKEITAPPPPFKSFAESQKEWQELHQEDATSFWKKQLPQEIKPLNYHELTRKETLGFKGEVKTFAVPLSAEKLQRLAKERDLSPTHLFFALYFHFLFAITKNSTISIGTPFINRPEVKFQKTFGCFINTMPITLKREECVNLFETAKILKEKFNQALPYSKLPFQFLLNQLNESSSASHHPIYQALYLFESNLGFRDFTYDNQPVKMLNYPQKWTPFDLELWIVQEKEQMWVNFIFNSSLFSNVEMNKNIRLFESMIQKTFDETHEEKALGFSLFYFSSSGEGKEKDKYLSIRKSVEKGEELGLEAVWMPERHFHPFGGLFPNSITLLSYLAGITKKIRLRTGSIVLPLHNPIRVAEELSLIDNLSNGRVDASFTCGWNPNDFTFAKEKFKERRLEMFNAIDTIKKLWKREPVEAVNGEGKPFNVAIYPEPLQENLNLWLTCTDHIEGFREAGEKGLNVLTALLFQSPEILAKKLDVYREALKTHHPEKKGHVTLMVHTYIGEDLKEVKALVKKPLLEYLKSSFSLWSTHAKKLQDVPKNEQEKLLEFAFEKFFNQLSLIGDQDKCERFAQDLQKIGVDEVACLIDFGLSDEYVVPMIDKIGKLQKKMAFQQKEQPMQQPDSSEDPLETYLKQLWKDILKKPVQEEIDFYHAGGNSLQLTELIMRIEEEKPELKLPISTFMKNPTLKYMKELLSSSKKEDLKTSQIDQDLALPISLVNKNGNIGSIANPQEIFITGGNGFIGSKLVYELLKTTPATLHCLVRGQNSTESERKLTRAVQRFGSLTESERNRLHVIQGDVSQDRLGLDEKTYQDLAATIEQVYHLAAQVSFTSTYAASRESNVLGVKRVIDFCMKTKIKPLIYFSTFNLYDAERNLNVIEDEAPLPQISKLDLGYEQTKYVGEKLVEKAGEQGLPILILRPGRVFYDMKSEVLSPLDFTPLLTRFIIECKAYPQDMTGYMHNIELDTFVKSVLNFAKTEQAYGKKINLVDPNPIPWQTFFQSITAVYKDIKPLSGEDFNHCCGEFFKGRPNDDISAMNLFYKERLRHVSQYSFTHQRLPSDLRKNIDSLKVDHKTFLESYNEAVINRLEK